MFNILEFWFLTYRILIYKHPAYNNWHSTKPSGVLFCSTALKSLLYSFFDTYTVWHTYLLYWCHNPAAVWFPDCSDFEVLKQHWSGADCYYKSLWSRGGVWVRATLIGKRRVTQLQCLLLPLPSFTEWGYCECVPLVWTGIIEVVGVLVHELFFLCVRVCKQWRISKSMHMWMCAGCMFSQAEIQYHSWLTQTLHFKINKLWFIVLGFVILCHKCFLSPNWTGKLSASPLTPLLLTSWRDGCLAHAEDLDFFCISSTCFISWVLVASLCCSRSAWPLVTPQPSGVDMDGHLGRPEAGASCSQYSRRDLEEIKTQITHRNVKVLNDNKNDVYFIEFKHIGWFTWLWPRVWCASPDQHPTFHVSLKQLEGSLSLGPAPLQ